MFLQVQESSNSQLSRLEELKRRLEALNPSRSSTTGVPSVRLLCTLILEYSSAITLSMLYAFVFSSYKEVPASEQIGRYLYLIHVTFSVIEM